MKVISMLTCYLKGILSVILLSHVALNIHIRWCLDENGQFDFFFTEFVLLFLVIYTFDTIAVVMTRRNCSSKEDVRKFQMLKKKFLEKCSHEMKTPLNGLIGSLDILSTLTISKEQEEYVCVARESSIILANIVSDHLCLTESEGHFIQSTRCGLSIKDTVRSVVCALSAIAENRNIHINTWFSDNIPPVLYADVSRLKILIKNILSIILRIPDIESVEMKFHLESFRDHIAIAGHFLHNTKHERPKMNCTCETHGSCLGDNNVSIRLCQLLVENMNGKIHIYDHSTIFSIPVYTGPDEIDDCYKEHISLKRMDSIPTPNQIKKITLSLFGGENDILLVEDNIVNQKIVKGFFERLGVSIDIACNGEEAIRMIDQDKRYKLFILDLELPKVSGMEVAKYVRTIKKYKNTPIVAYSAHVFSKKDEYEMIHKGDFTFIWTKPVTFASFLNLIKDISKLINEPN